MKKFLTALLVVNLFILDAVAGYYLWKNFFLAGEVATNSTQAVQGEPAFLTDGCDSQCQAKIYDEIATLKQEKNGTVSLTTTPTQAPVSIQKTTPVTKVKSVSYVPIPGNGSVLSTDWTDVSGTDFYLSKSDFEGLTGVYFEANFRLQNGNGTASLRIYDKTHSIAPSGGELSMSAQASTFVSGGPLYLWEGNNHYVVQARSSTSDTTIFESGRLKVITEN